MATLLVSAGDVSGDQHAAALIRDLRARRPGDRIVGLGGPAMAREGVELVASQQDLAVGGLVELLGSARSLRRAWKALVKEFRHCEPDLVILVDSSGFNLRFARRVRRSSSAKILYYVAPQVWAWRRGRIRKLAAYVDRLAVIFPFEPDVYAGTGLLVDFVGHPMVDELAERVAVSSPDQARASLGLEGASRWIALLPGSRRNEIVHQLPIQLEAARVLHERHSDLGFVLAVASSIDPEQVDALIARAGLPASLPLRCVLGQARAAICAADVVLLKPGTVTVEAMLLRRPMVVMGRANALTAALLRRVLRISYLGMPNLIAGEPIVTELLQREATPRAIAAALELLMEGPARARQLEGLARAARRLGKGGAAANTGRIVEEMLGAAPA
jgi:lipid-A-disaccharide synthase